MRIRKVGIAGAGKMSLDIFRLLLDKGFELVLWSPFEKEIEAAKDDLTKKLRKAAEKGGDKGLEATRRLEQLTFTTNLQMMADVDLVIEAVLERISLKKEIFAKLDAIVRPEAILVTNTSSLSPTSMSVVLKPERRPQFAGLHYFYPVKLVRFVELIRALHTSDETLATLDQFIQDSGKTALRVAKEVNGFLVNRLVAVYYNEGANVVSEGHYLPGEVDRISRRFASIGPCESVDHVGVDVITGGADSADASWGRERHCQRQNRAEEDWPPIYYRLRADGRYGRKTQAGFYKYENNQPVDDPEYLAQILPSQPYYHRVGKHDEDTIAKRILYSVLEESILVHDRGIASKSDIDLAARELLGFKQGPFEYIETTGVETVRNQALELVRTVGERYLPVGLLRREDEPKPIWEQDVYNVGDYYFKDEKEC